MAKTDKSIVTDVLFVIRIVLGSGPPFASILFITQQKYNAFRMVDSTSKRLLKVCGRRWQKSNAKLSSSRSKALGGRTLPATCPVWDKKGIHQFQIGSLDELLRPPIHWAKN